MRPLELQMEAFGPFAGTETIDFTQLGDRSLFLIAGPTGAGKSSILDAICFALYGESSGAEREGSQLRSDFADPSVSTQVVFTFQNGAKRYRICRSPRQLLAKRRGTGSTDRPATAGLVELPSTPGDSPTVLGTGVNDCRAAIEEILGLNCEQFRQVIVIPQGKFREMLTAKSEERERIFQNLFAMGRYRTLLERLKQAARGLEERIQRNRERKDTILAQSGSASAEALREAIQVAKNLLQTLARERAAAAESLQLASRRHNLARELAQAAQAAARNRKELADCQTALARAEGSWRDATARLAAEEAAEPERLRLRQQLGRLESLRPLLQQLEEAARQAGEARTALLRCSAEAEANARSLAAAKSREQALQPQLELARERGGKAGEFQLMLDNAKVVLERRKSLERLGREIATCREQLAQAEKQGLERRSAAGAAEERLHALLQQQHDGRAALLSRELRPGQPCPVCGSAHHPSPAPVDLSIPGPAEVKEAESRLKTAQEGLLSARENYGRLKRELEALQEKQAEALQAVGPDMTLAQCEEQVSRASAALEEARAAAASSERLLRERAALAGTIEALARTEGELQARRLEQQGQLDRAEARIETLSAQIEPAYREPGRLAAELASTAGLLQASETRLRQAGEARQAAGTARTELQTRIAEQQRQAESLREGYRAARESLLALAGENPDASLPPPIPENPERGTDPQMDLDLGGWTSRFAAEEDSRRADLEERNTRVGAQTQRIETLEQQAAQVAELERSFARAEAEHRVLGRVAEVADGRNALRLTFPRFVLGAILDDVLRCATHRLLLMSRKRFELYRSRESRRAGGLDLEVLDHHTGIARSVATLSGGESFLASLALALGLADVTQSYAGGIRMETMFIDEGFGSLDAEALDLAFSTLLDLQRQGRLVGVISHVAELKERIDARLEITPAPGGSHARFVL